MNETQMSLYTRINEIKNYLYCPRISFYTLCLRIDRETDLSLGGIAAEKRTKQLMKRRKNALHTVYNGIRHFDVLLESHRHHFLGRIDEIVETDEGVYLVDYKDTPHDYGYWLMQMTAYRLAALENGMDVLGCYVYIIPDQVFQPISPTMANERRLIALIKSIEEMVLSECCPPAVDKIGKCRSCQYVRICGDIY